MPPSHDQDTNKNNPSSFSPPAKKSASTGLQIPIKNGRKNGTAKDVAVGGVMAAVTKNNASKLNVKSPTPSPKFQPPESKPVVSPPNEFGSLPPKSDENPVTSPLLVALSSASMTPSTSQNTTDWARSVVSPFSTSPGNLISLGESPPTQPSSYEDRLANFGWHTREQRGIPTGHHMSASPPTRRPMSYQPDGNYRQGIEDHQPHSSAYSVRRSSMYSTYSNPRYGHQPPLPHQAQAHYYRAPDVNLLTSPPSHGLIPGDKGYFCGFDNLPTLQGSAKQIENVVVMGYEGGVDVVAVAKHGFNKVTKIEGLRGGVYDAKILPWTVGGGNMAAAPFIALVVHGPVWPCSDSSIQDYAAGSSEIASTRQAQSTQSSPRIPSPSTHISEQSEIEYYQTTVEIYSLSTNQHIITLLSLPKTQINVVTSSPLFTPPPPVGSLTIHAEDSGFLVVASGTSGEIWMFRQSRTDDDRGPENLKCIGKVWTSVQHEVTADPTGLNGLADGEWHQGDPSASRQQQKISILSLNGRWLAYCPSAPSSQTSIHASVPSILSTTRVSGLASQTSPQLPALNCLVETPGGESMMKQFAQTATQEMIKGATYIGKQGVSAWNNYWNKPAVNPLSNGVIPYQNTPNMGHQFPPTHGAPSQGPALVKDPGMVSILDLEALARHSASSNTSPHPLATFKVPHGCSFLSLSPNGLALFTASSKGDTQSVWDLMRIQYAKPSFLKTGPQGIGIQGPHVRQIAQFSRMTVARIIDVVWTFPFGERAAFVTEPGTVHILDLPASAFTWPPPRRKLPSSETGEGGLVPSLSAASVASSAVNSLWTAARPLVSRRRRSSTGIPTISAASVTSQAGHGTQVLAAGISRSVGAATGKMNEMRKSSSNKLHLPRQSSMVPSRSSIKLVTGKRSDSVMVVGGGIVGIYSVKCRMTDRPADKQKASRGAKYVEFRLPSLPDLKIAPEPVGNVRTLDLHSAEMDGSIRHFQRSDTKTAFNTQSSIPQAEIESNAPYQPFHTDNRVGIHVYSYEQPSQTSDSLSSLLSPTSRETTSKSESRTSARWAFGGFIKTENLNVCPPQYLEESTQSVYDHRALPQSAIERVMRYPGGNEDSEQIVITTRARRSARPGGDDIDADGEGFFEEGMEILDFASQRV